MTQNRLTIHLRLVLIALVLQSTPSTLSAARDNGWFDEGCDDATFHITTIDGALAGQELVLRLDTGNGIPLGAYLTGGDWLEAQGERCSGVGKCEQASQAKIWLNKGKGRIKRISGKYTVDFDAQHFEGQFVVKYLKPKNLVICE